MQRLPQRQVRLGDSSQTLGKRLRNELRTKTRVAVVVVVVVVVVVMLVVV